MEKASEDIERLGEKIASFRQKEAAVRHEHKKKTLNRASRLGLRIAVELMSALFVGLAIGYVADVALDTKPWAMAVFLFLGGAAGVLNVYRLAKSEEAQIEGDK